MEVDSDLSLARRANSLDFAGRSDEGVNDHAGKGQRFDRGDVLGRLGGQGKCPAHGRVLRGLLREPLRPIESKARRAQVTVAAPSRDSTAWRAAAARPAVLVAGAWPAAPPPSLP